MGKPIYSIVFAQNNSRLKSVVYKLSRTIEGMTLKNAIKEQIRLTKRHTGHKFRIIKTKDLDKVYTNNAWVEGVTYYE